MVKVILDLHLNPISSPHGRGASEYHHRDVQNVFICNAHTTILDLRRYQFYQVVAGCDMMHFPCLQSESCPQHKLSWSGSEKLLMLYLWSINWIQSIKNEEKTQNIIFLSFTRLSIGSIIRKGLFSLKNAWIVINARFVNDPKSGLILILSFYK